MTHADLVQEYGTASEAARQLGYSRKDLSRWKHAKNGIPFKEQFRIQMKTKGRLKATLPPVEAKSK